MEDYVGLFNYTDDLILIILLVSSIFKLLISKQKVRLYKAEKYLIILIFLFYLCGIISNLRSGIVKYNKDYILSGILFIKMYLIYFLCRISFIDIKINKLSLYRFCKILDFILNIYVSLIILNIPLGFLKVYDVRFNFIETVSVGFGHPSELSFMAISIMVLQLYMYILLGKNLKKYKYILIKSFFIVLFAGRINSIIFCLAYIIIFNINNITKKLKKSYIIPFIPIFIYISKSRIISEFLKDDSARGTLYKVSWKIAKDFFPLGSGFGTFGTEFSRRNYSPLYYRYHISSKYGLSPEWPAYITDAHWAATLGETGFVGIFIYATICIIMTYIVLGVEKTNLKLKLSISSLWIYGIISSFSDTILMGYRGVAIAIITSFLICGVNSYNNNLIKITN
ncbi:hypothetical protein J0A94_09220 [Paraclostridium bifermentans]|uniref:O-antigen ligase domain-containing protein n=1 Tax=Paraclostridium bifermentans TaxID=1490 RepID=A0AA44DI16_PARBF|nr:hypothetical protein [Paraclostridium bifermentans]MBN8048017.1 hypothetical protein [Paraclostridium bifermentans]NME08147.1 hypothetical protein [Paraclostridium bifermentans]